MFQVRLTSGKSFSVQGNESILDAAAAANIRLAYSCKTGRCSTCECRVISGTTEEFKPEMGLTSADRARGMILTCVRAATSDLELEVEDLGNVVLPPPRTLPSRIQSIERLAPDVVKVMLRLPPTSNFEFVAGQYINVIGPSGVRRSYSLARAPHPDKLLELHIREVEGGQMSRYFFNDAKVNDLLRFTGPLGTFFLRDPAGLDLVFLATGTGIAPVKSILETLPQLPAASAPRSVTVLWGGRLEQDLYIDMSGIAGEYVPVLSRSAAWKGEKGHVQDVLLRRSRSLQRTAVYACGSNAMIDGARAALTGAGLPKNRFLSDAFVCSAAETTGA